MAGVNDYFAIGSIVACKTCYNTVVEGEVQAFDSTSKMLVLKCPASDGKQSHNDVYILNLALVSDVQVKKEVSTPPEPAKQLNLDRINDRVQCNVAAKRSLIDAIRAGVTQEGLMLYHAIGKTINDITWDGPNIVILNQVKITPPYKAENIQGDEHNKAYIHIRKIVEKHLKDNQYNKGGKAADGGETKIVSSASSGVVAQSQ